MAGLRILLGVGFNHQKHYNVIGLSFVVVAQILKGNDKSLTMNSNFQHSHTFINTEAINNIIINNAIR
jgi:hypothetical protein